MADDTTTNDMIVKYGDFTIDYSAVPKTSLMAMLRRGTSHFFGSEQASKVTAHFDADAESPVEDTPEARAAVKAEFQKKAYDALLAGTVGVSTRGPTLDPIATIVRRLAKAEIVNVLKLNGVAWPKKAEDTITLPDGTAITGPQLIDRRVTKEGERLNREAKKIADEQARKAKKAQELAASEGLSGL